MVVPESFGQMFARPAFVFGLNAMTGSMPNYPKPRCQNVMVWQLPIADQRATFSILWLACADASVPSPRNSADHTAREPSLHSTTRDEKAGGPPASDPDTIMTGKRLAVAFAAMMLSQLLTALDQTILATALPRIASDFNSFSLQGWVATSFILAQTVFLLFYGQILRIYSAKWILVSSIAIFELGSLVCGIAQNVNQLIAGRAVSGLGAAGMFVAMFQVVSQITRFEDRPKLLGLFGVNFAISSVAGPLIGGAFTDHVTWRWCFFINLPVGGLSILGVVSLLKALPPLGSDPTKRSWRDVLQQTLQLDFVGAILVAGAVTTLVLALQWGGNTKPWGDKAVIICFVLAVVLTAVYVGWEIYMGDRAMTPTTIFKSGSVWAILGYSVLSRFSLLLFSFYIPIFYQSSAERDTSGPSSSPHQSSSHWAPASSTRSTPPPPPARIIGFQILAGIGIGMGMQNCFLAMQVEFRDAPALIGQANSMASFAQFFGGTIGVGVAEPVFASELSRYLLRYAPDAPAQVVKESPTAIYTALPAEMIPGVVRSYADALRIVFVLGVPVAGLALLCAMFIKKLKIDKRGAHGAAPAAKPDAEKVEET
ncbi:Major facilitator transporter-like protein [Mycena venus]|uniref:Major facilitator transporter-like protein n=1 Tax=Mycena venus TaxID=2733690 RepID=A0A8H6WQ39_9AGAR|nr:Major facilitator transporter-like protein [Mycena venus]